jgi:Ni/Co efflux regulator RcnB
MKTTAIVFAIAASFGFGSFALAQGNDRRGQNDELPRAQQHAPRQADQRGPQHHDNRVEQRVEQRVERRMEQRIDQRVDRRIDQRQDQRFDQRFDQRPGQRYDQRFDQRQERWNDRRAYYNARGPEFRRGGYIPREYRNPTYYITDYRPYRLPPPPRNHQWVQVGADYVLIAIATGIIANIVLNQ